MDRNFFCHFLLIFLGLYLISTVPYAHGYTYEEDVHAINKLYLALGEPALPGWIGFGGDPCLGGWQGVSCALWNITSINLTGANLEGELGDSLGNFSSLITLDLSNNRIGGTIPDSLPATVQQFFLSGNLLTGSIPNSLSQLTLLSDISLNGNHLTGQLPDVFQGLTGLINLDLSFNNLSGPLPASMGNLSSLTTLHVQENMLSGMLDVLQDLPLQDLNIENNMFSGPIPAKLLNIPNFERDGNPFNTSILLPPTLAPSPLILPKAPVPEPMPASPFESPANAYGTIKKSGRVSVLKIIGFSVTSVVIIVIGLLILAFCISKQKKKLKLPYKQSNSKGLDAIKVVSPKVHHYWTRLNKPHKESERVSEELDRNQLENKIDININGTYLIPPALKEDTVSHEVDFNRVILNPVKVVKEPMSATNFSVASLQQYTNSFSEENLIKENRIGRLYLGQVPHGKMLAILKLSNAFSTIPSNEFAQLVSRIYEIQHPNIVQMVGYCSEFGQRLLVNNYFSRISLEDALYHEDDFKKKFAWYARMQVAFEAAKAIEYLHVGCHPPIVHQKFEPSSILINEDLAVQVSDCGLSTASSFCLTQLLGDSSSYQAPEVSESGFYSEASDVYSFGVVMLVLLTGRKPYDNSLPQEERHLVQWASSQLHDFDTLMRMSDPSMNGLCPVKPLSRFADIISRCIQETPEFRPPISDVVQDLDRVLEDVTMLGNGVRG